LEGTLHVIGFFDVKEFHLLGWQENLYPVFLGKEVPEIEMDDQKVEI
jgi:hypothetical protein